MRYLVLIMGNPSGQQVIWTTADGKLHDFFQFNDRGRWLSDSLSVVISEALWRSLRRDFNSDVFSPCA
jgi:hypothetical protein